MSDGKVISLDGRPGPGSDAAINATIELLEDLLASARAGQLEGVAVACYYVDGTADWWRAGGLRPATMIGALELMKSEIVADTLGEAGQ